MSGCWPCDCQPGIHQPVWPGPLRPASDLPNSPLGEGVVQRSAQLGSGASPEAGGNARLDIAENTSSAQAWLTSTSGFSRELVDSLGVGLIHLLYSPKGANWSGRLRTMPSSMRAVVGGHQPADLSAALVGGQYLVHQESPKTVATVSTRLFMILRLVETPYRRCLGLAHHRLVMIRPGVSCR